MFDGFVGETVARAVVDLQRRWVLGVAKLNEGMAKWNRFFAVDAGGSCFCFGRACEHFFGNAAKDKDRSVGWRGRCGFVDFALGAQTAAAGEARSGLRNAEARSIAVNAKLHVAGAASNGGFGMSGTAVEEPANILE